MEHEEIRLKLAAYLDNAVSPEEKEEIRKHLAMCGGCRGEIADLELTVKYLKTLPEVDPPSWLADKIMAKVREEGGQKLTLWEKLFSPLHVKLPIEVFAVLFICVTGFYLTRMINEEAPITAKPSSITPGLTKAPPPSHRESEVRSVPALPKTQIENQKRVNDYPLRKEEEAQAPLSAATPKPQESTTNQEKAPQSRREVEPELQSTGRGYILGRERRSDVREEKGTATFKAGKKEKSLEGEQDSAGAVLQQAGNMEITLIVDEPAAAPGKIEDAVTSLGGRINGHSYSKETNLLFIRIRADRGKELVDRLGRIGAVKRYPQFSSDTEGTIDMIIRW